MNGTSGVSGLLFFSKERGFVFLLLPPECAGYIIKYTFYPVMVKTSTLLLRVGFDQQRTSFFLLVPRTCIVFKKNKKIVNRKPILKKIVSLFSRHCDGFPSFFSVSFRCRPGRPKRRLSRKEVFQPHLPVRLPCYDLAPVTSFALGRSLTVTNFRYPRLPWLDGRCVQGPGTYSPRRG